LENGLTVLVAPNRKLPKVFFRIGIRFGQKNDPEGKEGAAELLGNTLKKGTLKRTSDEIAERVDYLGGYIGTSVSRDFFHVYSDFLKEYFDTGMDLFSDVILNARFIKQEVSKEKEKLLVDMENEKSSPAFLAQRRFDRVLFSSHPYSKYKRTESVQGITNKSLRALHDQFFVPENAYLIVAGDVTSDEAIDKAKKYFGNWKSKKARQTIVNPPQTPENQIFLIDRPESEQSYVLIGGLLFARNNPEFEKFQVVNKILGGGANGRLFMKLREEKGYTYGAYSSMSPFYDSGRWEATAEVGTKFTAPSVEAFLEEFKLIREKSADEKELVNAKRYLVGNFPIKSETSSSIALLVLTQKLHRLPDDYWNNYLKKIDRISITDIQQVAQKHIDLKGLIIVIVGDAKKIKDSLNKFGSLKIYNMDDVPIH
jgi:predicted Zn-dependent peptidase